MRPRRPPAEGKGLDKLEELLHLDPFQVELGYGLVALADKRQGGDLLERVTGVRRNFAQEMGVMIPPIRLRDNLQLGPNEYRFLLKGNPVAQGELRPGHWLAMNAANSKVVLKGVPTVEPVFQLPATWVTDAERKTAELAGFTVVDAPSVLVTHLSETVRRRLPRDSQPPGCAGAARQPEADASDARQRTGAGAAHRRPGAAHPAEPAGRRHFHPQPGGILEKVSDSRGAHQESG